MYMYKYYTRSVFQCCAVFILINVPSLKVVTTSDFLYGEKYLKEQTALTDFLYSKENFKNKKNHYD